MFSPLLAMKSGNTELAKALINISNSQEEIIDTILRRAVQSDDYDLVKYILAEIKSRDIEFESKEILKSLLMVVVLDSAHYLNLD